MVDESDELTRVLPLSGHPMPGYWRYILPEDFQWLRLPKERLATCDNCFWAATGDCRSDCQCCTYFPQLPNFSLGLALRDPVSQGATARLVAAGHTLPQGLVASPRQYEAAAQMQAEDRFGEAPQNLCPFLEAETMNCKIYPYRNSVCSTFFCENDHGDAGAEVWSVVQLLAGHAETVLAQWAMTRVGLDAAGYIRRLDELAGDIQALAHGDPWPEAARRHLWADWFGKEEEFFGRCADEISAQGHKLYDIACEQTLLEAKQFEAAVRDWVPEPARSEIPPVTDVDPTPIPDLWYRVQLKIRQLWQLAFGEGEFTLGRGAQIEPNPSNDLRSQACAASPWMVSQGGQRVFISEGQKQVLDIFVSPTALDEALMDRPEVTALDDARGFLAEMFRRGILTQS